MKNRAVATSLLTGLAVLLSSAQAMAQLRCYAVTPTGAGTKTGSTWANALPNLPATFMRNAIYYLADGNYGHTFTWNTPTDGTKTVELRKAQPFDYGQMASVCTNNLDSDASWNSGAMGSAQAVWSSGGSGIIGNIDMSYLIVNGNGSAAGEIGCGNVYLTPPASMKGPAPDPAACGIKIDDSTCTATATDGCDGGNGVMRGAGSNITWESVEWFGQGLNTDGNNNSETYFWATFGANDLSNVTITHSYLHNASTTYFTVVSGGWNNGSFDHNYLWGLFDGMVNHGEAIQLQGFSTGDVVHHNVFRDQATNGDMVAVITGTQRNMAFYDNVDFCTSDAVDCHHNDGVIGCFNSQTCDNYLVYDNTFAFKSNCGWNVSGGPSTMTVKNNLWYGCTGVGMTGGTNTVDDNSYLNSSQAAVGAHDVSSASAPNPFVSATSFELASENALWSGRTSLGAPFDVDITGIAFTTDRGAYQYCTGACPFADAGSGGTDAGSSKMDGGSAMMDAGSSKMDAGSSKMDAGSSGVDSGSAKKDGGSTKTDAGSSSHVDSGESLQDAGGSSPGVSKSSGCGCRTAGAQPASQSRPLLFALLGFGLMRRRRRR